jgi:hypothetical protein
MVPFAGGGQSYGRDTVPALLTPGEFIMNPKATRQFYSKLIAMNSGRSTFSGGGKSVTVGDVNVSLNSVSPDYDARAIGKALRREVRRGRL